MTDIKKTLKTFLGMNTWSDKSEDYLQPFEQKNMVIDRLPHQFRTRLGCIKLGGVHNGAINLIYNFQGKSLIGYGGTIQDGTDTYVPPTTVEVTGHADDGYIYGQDAVYATARNTSYAFNAGISTFHVGQGLDYLGRYTVLRGFLLFDTSSFLRKLTVNC